MGAESRMPALLTTAQSVTFRAATSSITDSYALMMKRTPEDKPRSKLRSPTCKSYEGVAGPVSARQLLSLTPPPTPRWRRRA
jgi:hypothetical protein